jgi:hypothetical protein
MRLVSVRLLIIALVVSLSTIAASDQGKHPTWNPTAKERGDIYWLPLTQEDVLLAYEGVSMPLGRILLVRKGAEYCALKFTDTWLGETERDHYSSYEFHYQGDGSGDFMRSNVLAGTGELYFPRKIHIIFDLGYQKDRNTTIICGDMKLDWLFIASIHFKKYELAPTPWTTIQEVNIQDPRIRWYKRNDVEKKISIPIEQLWESHGKRIAPGKDDEPPK